jgi:diaminopimelate epimerase
VNVGSDHLVIKKEDVLEFKDLALDDIPLSDFAPQLRLHPDFSPRGVNVNVYSILDKNVIQLRTYERGVEGETAACGTGTISTALIAASKGEVTFPVTVIPKSGIPLVVDTIYNSHQEIESIILEGTAEIIGHAQIEIAL